MSANITAQDYVVWVKGSLNRWLGAGLNENGDTAPPYRGWVKEFQALCAVCTRNGDVDEATQNALIKANHQHELYMNWVVESLNQGLQGAALAGDGSMTSQTIATIKKFRAANELQPNGWVGAKTETALRKKRGRKPPAMPAKFIPTILRPKWGGRTARELAKFWSDQWLLAPLSEPLGTISPPFNVLGQLLLRSFVTALWRYVYDNEYVPAKEVENFVYAGAAEGPFGGIEPDQLRWNFKTKRIHDALQTLIMATGDIMAAEHWSYADGYNTFKGKLMDLYKDIHEGLINIRWHVRNNSRVNNLAIDIMGDWLKKKDEEGSNSILRFFPKT